MKASNIALLIEQPMARIVIASICFLILGLFGMWVAVKERSIDYPVYYMAAKAHVKGLNIYTVGQDDWNAIASENGIRRYAFPYLYPPLTAGIVSLIGKVAYRPALLIWTLSSVGAVFLSGCALSQVIRRQWFNPAVFAALTVFFPIYTTLYAGQVNNFVLLTVCLFLWLLKNNRTYAAYIALGVGIMLKPITGPLLAHTLWLRDKKKIFACVFGLCTALACGILLTDWATTQYYLQHATEISHAQMPLAASINGHPQNQSLTGFFARLFSVDVEGNVLYFRIVALCTAALFVLIVASLTWPYKKVRHMAGTFESESALVLVTANLITPTAWFHHLAISAVPLILGWHASETRLERAALSVALVFLFCQGGFWHRLDALNPFLLSSLGTYALFLIFAVSAWQLYRIKLAAKKCD